MVRFIMTAEDLTLIGQQAFTFQYGQIYYVHKKTKKRRKINNLHSNMVRFIIRKDDKFKDDWEEFTFQYGQIYYQAITIQMYQE